MSETNAVDTTNPVQALTGTARVIFVIGGLITAVVGVMLLVWPERTPELRVLLTLGAFAIYAVSVGVIGLVLGVFGRGLASWRRGGHSLIGLLLLVSGVVALSGIDPDRTNTGTILGVVVGIVWIIQGVFSVAETDRSKDTLWSIIFGVVSVLAGIALLIAPLFGTGVLWIFLGITLLVLGIAQLARGQRIGDWTSNPIRPERAVVAPRQKTPKAAKPAAAAKNAATQNSTGDTSAQGAGPKVSASKDSAPKNSGSTSPVAKDALSPSSPASASPSLTPATPDTDGPGADPAVVPEHTPAPEHPSDPSAPSGPASPESGTAGKD